VLPPGWARIPLRDGTEAAIREILDGALATLGPDVPRDKVMPLRAELEKRLLAEARTARGNEGIDLYLPVERVHGKTIAASFVIGLLPFTSVEVPEAEDVLVALAAQADDARFVEVDGAGAVRWEERRDPEPAAADAARQYASRRVVYVITVPDERDIWLTATFGTVGDGDPDGEVARVLVELFDAVLSTFRWVRAA